MRVPRFHPRPRLDPARRAARRGARPLRARRRAERVRPPPWPPVAEMPPPPFAVRRRRWTRCVRRGAAASTHASMRSRPRRGRRGARSASKRRCSARARCSRRAGPETRRPCSRPSARRAPRKRRSAQMLLGSALTRTNRRPQGEALLRRGGRDRTARCGKHAPRDRVLPRAEPLERVRARRSGSDRRGGHAGRHRCRSRSAATVARVDRRASRELPGCRAQLRRSTQALDASPAGDVKGRARACKVWRSSPRRRSICVSGARSGERTNERRGRTRRGSNARPFSRTWPGSRCSKATSTAPGTSVSSC